MDKLQMAQEYIVSEIRRVGVCSMDDEKVKEAWRIADAMQAEADKRVDKSLPNVFKKDSDGNCLHTSTTFGGGECFDCGAPLKEEWQPDWSQAPEWANYLVMSLACTSYWSESEPRQSGNGWVGGGKSGLAWLDGYYGGNWRDSLRKRQ